MESRSIDLISKKKNCTCSTLFFLISKKTNLHVQHAFCLSLPLFCTTTTVFCGTKTSNFLVTHDFYRGIVVCAYPILSPVFMFTFIFHCRSFSPCWPLVVVASICHTRNFISYTRENKLRLTIAANTQYKWYKIYVHGLFNPRPAQAAAYPGRGVLGWAYASRGLSWT